MHLHHLVSFHSDKENCNTLTESSTSDVYPVSGYIVLESSRHQAAIPFAARAAEKAGWIITTVVSLSFHFCLSLEAVFYLRVLLSQNPVEPITAPYEIVKVYRFGRRRCPTTFPNPCIFQTANLSPAMPVTDPGLSVAPASGRNRAADRRSPPAAYRMSGREYLPLCECVGCCFSGR